MARNGKRVLAIVLSMALLISTLTGALIGLVGSADSASGASGGGLQAEGIINIPLKDQKYEGTPVQQGSNDTDTELIIAKPDDKVSENTYWETVITLNKAYNLSAAQYADIKLSITEHYNPDDALNIVLNNGATYTVKTADLEVGKLNTVRLKMDATLEWYEIKTVNLSLVGNGKITAAAQYGFAAFNFYTNRIALGDVANSNLDGSVDVKPDGYTNRIGDHWVAATAFDVGTFFESSALEGTTPIASNYKGEATDANIYGGGVLTSYHTNSAEALKTIDGKKGYVWNGTLRAPIVGEYFGNGVNLTGKKLAVNLYIEKEMTGNEYGEIWIELSSYNKALHSWNKGVIGNDDYQIGFFVAVRYLDQGWNTIYLDPNVPGGRGGTPLAGTLNTYGVFKKTENDWNGDGANDLYTDPYGTTNDGWWLYARDDSGKKLTDDLGDLYHNRQIDLTSVHNYRVVANGMAVSTVGKLAVGEMGILATENDNAGYILTGDESEYNTFFWASDGVLDPDTTLTIEQWCAQKGKEVADAVQPGNPANNPSWAAKSNGAQTLKWDQPYGDGARGYYYLKSTTQGLDKYFATPISLSGSYINAWIYVQSGEELTADKQVTIRFSSYPYAQHNHNAFWDYSARADIPASDLKAGWNLITINPGAVAKVGNVYGVTKGVRYNPEEIYNLIINRTGSTAWSKYTGIGAIYETGVVNNTQVIADKEDYLLTGDETEIDTFFWSRVDGLEFVTVGEYLNRNDLTMDNIQPGVDKSNEWCGINGANALKTENSYGDGTRGYYLLSGKSGAGLDKYNKTGWNISGAYINAWVYIGSEADRTSGESVFINFSSYSKAMHAHLNFREYSALAEIPAVDLKVGWNLVTIDPSSQTNIGSVYGVTKGANFDPNKVYNLIVNRDPDADASSNWSTLPGIGAIYKTARYAKSDKVTISGNLSKVFNASNSTYFAMDITMPEDSAAFGEMLSVSLGVKDWGNEGANDLRWEIPLSQVAAGVTTTVKFSLLSPQYVYPFASYTNADLNSDQVSSPYSIHCLDAIDSISVTVTKYGFLEKGSTVLTVDNITFLDDYIEVAQTFSAEAKAFHVNNKITAGAADAKVGSDYVAKNDQNKVAFFVKDRNHSYDENAGETQLMSSIMSLNSNDMISLWIKAKEGSATIDFVMEFASGATGANLPSNYAVRYERQGLALTNEWQEVRFKPADCTKLGGNNINWENVNFVHFFNSGTATDYMVDGLRVIKATSIEADTSKVLNLRQDADVSAYDISRNMIINATYENGTTDTISNNANDVKYDLSQVNTKECGTYPIIVTYNNGLTEISCKTYVEVVADKNYLLAALPNDSGVRTGANYVSSAENEIGDKTFGTYRHFGTASPLQFIRAQFEDKDLSEATTVFAWVYVADKDVTGLDLNLELNSGTALNSTDSTLYECDDYNEIQWNLNSLIKNDGWNLVALDIHHEDREGGAPGYHHKWGDKLDLSKIKFMRIYGQGQTEIRFGSIWYDTAESMSVDATDFKVIDCGNSLNEVSWDSIDVTLNFADGNTAPLNWKLAGLDESSVDTFVVGHHPVGFDYTSADSGYAGNAQAAHAHLTATAYVEVSDAQRTYLFNGYNILYTGASVDKSQSVTDLAGETYVANQGNPEKLGADQQHWLLVGEFTPTDLTSADSVHILFRETEDVKATGAYRLEINSSAVMDQNKIDLEFTAEVKADGRWHEIVLDLHTGKKYSDSPNNWTTTVDGTQGTEVIPDLSAAKYLRLYIAGNTTNQPAVARIWVEKNSIKSYDLIEGASYEKVKHNTQKTLFGTFQGKSAYKWNSATDLVSAETDELYSFYWSKNLLGRFYIKEVPEGEFKGGLGSSGTIDDPEWNLTNGPDSIQSVGGRNAYKPYYLQNANPVIAKRLLTPRNLVGKKILVNVYLSAKDTGDDGEIWVQLDDSGYSITDANAGMRVFVIPVSALQVGWNTVTLDPNKTVTDATGGEIGYSIYNNKEHQMYQEDGTLVHADVDLQNDPNFDLTKVSTIITRSSKMGVEYAIGKIQETTPANDTYFKKFLAPISVESAELLQAEFYVEDLSAFTSAEVVMTSSNTSGAVGTRTFTITKENLGEGTDGWYTVYLNNIDAVSSKGFDPKMVQIIEIKSTVTMAMDLAIAKLTMHTASAHDEKWAKVDEETHTVLLKNGDILTAPHAYTAWSTKHDGTEKHRECVLCGHIQTESLGDEDDTANGNQVTGNWTRFQESDSKLLFKGTWTSVRYGVFTDSYALRTTSPTATLSFSFNGSGLQINSYSSPSQGSFDVVVTDSTDTVVRELTFSMKEDTYSDGNNRPEKNSVGWASAMIIMLDKVDSYDVQITSNGDGFVWIDAIDICSQEGGMLDQEENNQKMVIVEEDQFHGFAASSDWQNLKIAQFSGGTASRTKVGGAELSLSFIGAEKVELVSYLSPNYGACYVTLTEHGDKEDVSETQYIDLKQDATLVDSCYQRTIFSKMGLDQDTVYTITITNAIDGKWCLVDALVLYGENPYKQTDNEVSTTNLYTQDTRVLGRYLPNESGEGLTLAWTNSGIEFEFVGTAAYLDMATDKNTALLGVVVDGDEENMRKFTVSTEEKKFTLAENLPKGTHTIKLLKLSEAYSSLVNLGTLRVQGRDIQPTVAQERVIEFIGDSITSGYGTGAASATAGYSIEEQDASLAYPYLLATEFGAEAQIISRSGIGVSRSNGHPLGGGTDETMPQIYEYASYKQQSDLTDAEMTKWSDVTHATPDAIVINLGTNDYADEVGKQNFLNAYKEFLPKVRELNPEAEIFVTYGVMKSYLNDTIKDLVAEMNETDPKIHFVDILGAEYDLQGAGGHPSAADHQKIAEILINSIGTTMKWN